MNWAVARIEAGASERSRLIALAGKKRGGAVSQQMELLYTVTFRKRLDSSQHRRASALPPLPLEDNQRAQQPVSLLPLDATKRHINTLVAEAEELSTGIRQIVDGKTGQGERIAQRSQVVVAQSCHTHGWCSVLCPVLIIGAFPNLVTTHGVNRKVKVQ